MKVSAFGMSDVGKRREKNEDRFLINEDLNLYVVADGMGGHLGGDFASNLAVTTVDEIVGIIEKDPDNYFQNNTVPFKNGEFQAYLRYSIQQASLRIYEQANQNSALHGMGTTTVALLFRDGKVYVANVGDSRAYRIRDNNIDQITKDHSLVGEQVRAGILSESDAKGHRLKNIITRSVGFQEGVDSDIDIKAVRRGDKFLLCSDGLSNLVKNDEIRDVVGGNSLEDACRRLIDVANERGGDDNITVVLTEVVDLGVVSEDAISSDDSTIEL